MRILIVDGQGGGIGKELINKLKKALPEVGIIAVGTNSIASSVMKKAGADIVATGENAVIVNSRYADVIAGPVGVIAADALYGEVTPAMANAIAGSRAEKVLIPFKGCGIFIAGSENCPPGELIASATAKIRDIFRRDEKK